MKKIRVTLTVNGHTHLFETDPNRTLLEVLREDIGLTGVKEGCGEGECGACTVIMNDEPINSCLVLIGQADNSNIETIEGLAKDGKPHPLQKAFVELGAVQCGFCTPGMIMASKALLDRNPHPDEEQIREALSGNICRCTGYKKIIEAVQSAAEEMSHE
jgi:aerobic-type carbon monoxide dehydrogenase small subunit (CoxS/CutS family)